MSEDLRVNLTRAGQANPIATNVVVQSDEMNALEATTYQGADPHFTYKCFTTLLPLNNPQFVLFRDHMIDQVVIDTITNTNRKFLIISEPKLHVLDGYWTWVCTRMRGT